MKQMGHLPVLDGVRGVAILFVLAHHLHRPLAPGGDTGVDLFFILSGFLITKLMIEEYDKTGGVDLRSFYRRRAFRIIPALFVACVGAVAVAYIWRSDARPVVWREVAYALGFAGNLREVFHPVDYPTTDTYLLGATWSLGIEEQFYWVWPAVLLLFPAAFFGRERATKTSTGMQLIVGAVVLGLFTRLVIGAALDVRNFELLPFLNMDGLILGAGLAFLFHHRRADAPTPKFFASIGPWLLIVGVGIDFLAASQYIDNNLELRSLAIRIAYAAIVWWLLTAGKDSIAATVLRLPILRWFGMISYSLYLWHIMIFAIFDLDRLADRSAVSSMTLKLVGLAVSIMVSWLSYKLVEQPMQDWRRRIDARKSASAPPTSLPDASTSSPV